MAHGDLHLHRLRADDFDLDVATIPVRRRAVRSRQLTGANPRLALEHDAPAGPVREPVAWRSQHEPRIRAAIAAARQRR